MNMAACRGMLGWIRPNPVSRTSARVSWTPAPAFSLRNYATTPHEDQVVSETKRTLLVISCSQGSSPFQGAEKTLKRFWKTVGIDTRTDGIAVTLDKRALKTPSGHTLLLPENKRLVATLIANEWENQEMLLKPHALPMVCNLVYCQTRGCKLFRRPSHLELSTLCVTRKLVPMCGKHC